MRLICLSAVSAMVVLAAAVAAAEADPTGGNVPAKPQLAQPAPRAQSQPAAGGGSVDVDVNRPRTPFDCELPNGQKWYGSRARCLAYMCGGENVYNEYVFDADGRRRKNPCYGQSPTELPPE